MSAATIHQSLPTLLFLFFFTSLVQASELDELATTQRLLDQVQLSLDRARTVAAQSDPNNRRRYLFDYKKRMKISTPCVLALTATRSPRVRSRWITARSAAITRGAFRYGDDSRADQRV
ncbi:RAQPRD family integrative conjugative element protein [Pantoea vagans]|jgi:RAQPRD family integrative conjugative element protein|uniref:RAQPRD family integrative conjugative element protein n=1 Tax=Pantoea vagans TaxID=470934 RepID=UPI00211C72AA|nr:RAQPRD family integrative conjugative element protein [Pantoea vagans]